MNRKTCIVALSTAIAASAFAAAPAAAGAGDWSGFYAGVQAGGSWGDIEQRIPSYGSVPDGDIDGWLAGAYAGYYMPMQSVVLGLELGGNWREVDGENGVDNDPETLETNQNWDASLVGKVGYPVNSMLIYGLAGVALTEMESNYAGGLGTSSDGSDTVWGWTIGVGAEMAISQQLTGRLEYRFADYEEADVQCAECGSTFVDPRTHTIALGLSYNF